MRSSRPSAHVGQGPTLFRVLCSTLLASGLTLMPAPAASQGTAADYARAEGLRARIEGLVLDLAEAPIWIGAPSSQFVYRKSVQGGSAFVLVDPVTLEKQPAFEVVNALIKTNKAFDLLVIPGAGHTNGGPYGERKRNDFFVHNLLGVEPPDRNGSVASTSDGSR